MHCVFNLCNTSGAFSMFKYGGKKCVLLENSNRVSSLCNWIMACFGSQIKSDVIIALNISNGENVWHFSLHRSSIVWRSCYGKFDQININLPNATPFHILNSLNFRKWIVKMQYKTIHAILYSTCYYFNTPQFCCMQCSMLYNGTVMLLLLLFCLQANCCMQCAPTFCYHLIRLSLTHPDTKISSLRRQVDFALQVYRRNYYTFHCHFI